jgi:uncharacterized cupin superfamily protein
MSAVAPALLLCVGIHNAGDAITYSVIKNARARTEANNGTEVRGPKAESKAAPVN